MSKRASDRQQTSEGSQHDDDSTLSHSDAGAAQPTHSAEPLPEQAPAQRVASSMTHPFDRLAAVECQLILQWLDNTSRLVASRCSRTLRAEASHPFSWRYAEPVTLLSSQVDTRLPLVESSLLRLAPLNLEGDVGFLSAAQVLAVPRLRGLTSAGAVFQGAVDPVGAWAELLSHASMQQLRTLHCPFDRYMSGHMSLIVRLPHLTSLAFQVDEDARPEGVALLSTAPASLTSIQCAFSFEVADEVRVATLHALTRMPQLRRLWLAEPPFAVSTEGESLCTSLRSLLTSLGLAQLTHLTLDGVDMRLTPEEGTAAFRALTHLTHLRLIRVREVDLLLASVPHARSLEHLCVYVIHVASLGAARAQPSVDVLRTLLESLPLLHVRLAPLSFIVNAESWPAHVACAQLPRVLLTPKVYASDIRQDTY